MLAQERVRRGSVGDARSEANFGFPPRFPERDAVATVGDDPVHDRGCPLAAPDDADDRRIRQAQGSHQRIGLRRVSGDLVDLEGADDVIQVRERRDALAAH